MKQIKLFQAIFCIGILFFSCKTNNTQSGKDSSNVSSATNIQEDNAADGIAKLSCMIDGKPFSIIKKNLTSPTNLKQNDDGSHDGLRINIGKHPDNTNAGFQFVVYIKGHTTVGQRVNQG